MAFFTFNQWPMYSSLSFSCSFFAYLRIGSMKSGRTRRTGYKSRSAAVWVPRISENFSKPWWHVSTLKPFAPDYLTEKSCLSFGSSVLVVRKPKIICVVKELVNRRI
jgi:hypothetical protein